MALEHGDGLRLTPEQRDRVLDLAARLQAQHDGTVAVEDLAQASAEAGIDPRFFHQALATVSNPSTQEGTRPKPLEIDRRFALETLIAAAIPLAIVMSLRQEGYHDAGTAYTLVFLLMAVLGFRAHRRRVPAPFVPILAYAVAYLFLGSGNPSIERIDPQSSPFTAQGPFVLLLGPLTGTLTAWIVDSWLANRKAWRL